MTNAEPQSPRTSLVCPLCGGHNGCAPAASGSFDVDCWCRDVTFIAELLERLPVDRRGVSCICQRCAAAGAQDRATSA